MLKTERNGVNSSRYESRPWATRQDPLGATETKVGMMMIVGIGTSNEFIFGNSNFWLTKECTPN